MPKKFYFAIFTVALFASCVSSRVNVNAFPADFKNSEYVLLLQKRTSGINPRGMNNYLTKSFKKYYSGKWEMASIEDIKTDPKYNNKEVYRYILIDDVRTSSGRTVTTERSGTASRTTIGYDNSYSLDYHLYDRIDDKAYPKLGIASGVPAKAMVKVANALDQHLKE